MEERNYSKAAVHKTKRINTDLTGIRFGRLIVRKPTEKRKDGCIVWECRCDCGGICYVSTNNLKRGAVKSCGCIRKSQSNITGQKFGRLTAIRALGAVKGKSMLWECQCECGNMTQALINNLKNGHTRSCGCLKKVDQLGHVDGTCLSIIGSKKIYRNNISGVKGVSISNGRFTAYITFKGVRYNLGSYKNEEEAIIARQKGEQMYFHPFLEQSKHLSKQEADA